MVKPFIDSTHHCNLILIFNALIRRVRPAWRLSPAELIYVLSMGLVVSGLPIFMLGYLIFDRTDREGPSR